MKEHVDLEAVYPFPPERVWEALTNSDAADFQPLIGYRFRLDRPDQNPIKGKVIEVETAKILAYTWEDDDEGQESVVVWTLEPKDGGTQLRLQHRLVEAPVVNCLSMDLYFNWRHALRMGLPQFLRHLTYAVRPPIVYVDESQSVKEEVKA